MTPDSLTPLDALTVEDSPDDTFLLKSQLERGGYQVMLERVDTRDGLLDALKRKHWDIVFSDFSMPRLDGIHALQIVREHDRDLPFIILSGTIGEERAVQLMKLGAQDYIIKGNIQRLLPAVERELKEARLRREHRLAQAHIQHLAYYDSLTHLPNRQRLIEDLHQHLGGKTPAALMIVNVTNFREINGALGYSKGDDLICETAARLQGVVAEGVLYHLHGNEFAILADTQDRARLETIAQGLLKTLGPPLLSAGFRIPVRARLGIALTTEGQHDAHALLQSADLASMFARREGRPYAWYQPERDPSHPERLALLADLYDALETPQLSLAFQPKIARGTGEVTGAEALLRWHHPEFGPIAPDSFIGMAEQSGLIDDLTRQVVARTAAQIRKWRQQGLHLPIAMNLSAKNLPNPEIISEILSAARDEPGQPASIELEITETALMRDPDRALAALHQLDDAGIRIYIDDFGTGFSSLGYLKKLPIHAIKIDKSFVMDLTHNADSDAIVRSTIALAHNLDLKIVAEGVENIETWERLQQYECDEGQGYLFSKPVTAESFEKQARPWVRK